MTETKQDTLEIMLEMAKQAMERAYCPYSGYSVGACVRCEEDISFSGTNVENASYGLTSCAEGSAIAAMVQAGYRKIQDIVIIGRQMDEETSEKTKKTRKHKDTLCTPCGACRQRIYEFSTKSTLIHLADETGIKKTLTIARLLPHAFGPKHIK